MVRRVAIVAFVSSSAAALAIACSSFSSNDTPASDGGVDVVVPPGPPPPSSSGDATPGDGGPVPIACDAGAPPPEHVVTDEAGVDDLAADGTHVYWASAAGQRIARVTIADGQKEDVTVDAGVGAGPSTLALSSARVYFIAGHPSYAIKGTNVAATLIDGTPAELVAALPSAGYYSIVGGVREVQEPSTSYHDVVVATTPRALSAGGSSIAYVGPLGDAGALMLVWMVPDTAQTGVLGSGSDVGRLANDDTTVWLTAPGAGEVVAVDVADAGRTVLATGQDSLGALVAQGADLFFSTSAGVRRVSKTGGCVALVSDTPSNAIAATADWVYFVRSGTDILRVHR